MIPLSKVCFQSLIFVFFCLLTSQGYAQISDEGYLLPLKYRYAFESAQISKEKEECEEVRIMEIMGYTPSEIPAEASTSETHYDFDEADWERKKRKCRKLEKEERKQQESEEEEYMKNLWREYGPDFIEESLNVLHGDLEEAIFMSDYYLACLENNDTWFSENSEKLNFFYEERKM